MSFFQTFVDALVNDLTTNVAGLRNARIHRYAPWDPEQLMSENGDRHLAVFPAAEAVEDAVPLVTGPGGDMLVELYRVIYWEGSIDEPARGLVDQQAAADLLELMEATRDRLYVTANLQLGGADHVRYAGATLPERSGLVRWFQIGVQVRTSVIVS